MNSGQIFSKRAFHPYVNANILSRFTFFYVTVLIKKYFKEKIDEDGLYETLPNLRSQKLGDELERIFVQYSRNDPLLVTKIIFRRFGRPYLMVAFLYIIFYLIRTNLEPFLISKILRNFTESRGDNSTFQVALTAAISLILLYLMITVLINYVLFWTHVIGLQIAVGLSSLIYRKALLLRNSSKCETIGGLGNVVTLITKDVLIFDNLLGLLYIIPYFIICLVMVTTMICQKVGVVGFSSSVVILITIICQLFFTKIMYFKRLKVALDTASRIETIREALTAIRFIKMYTWESHFVQKVGNARRKEMKGIFMLYFLRMLIYVMGTICAIGDVYVFLVVYIFVYKTINAETLYYSMILLNSLRVMLSMLLPGGLSGLWEVFAGIKRIQQFLSLDEPVLRPLTTTTRETPQIYIDGTITYSSVNISLNQKGKGLIIIKGSSSSGKSALLKSFLGDYPVNGSVEICGKLSYASQEAWIFPSTIKQNIIFGHHFEQARYNKILEICALEHDLNQFKKGDESVLTDCGANLSKGQRARINLARALYHKADIYLLDDNLSSLDPNISKIVFRKISDFLKDCIVLIVVPNNFHCAKNSAKTIILIENDTAKVLDSSIKIEKQIGHNNSDFGLPNNLMEDLNAKELNEESEIEKFIVKPSNCTNIYHEVIEPVSISVNTLKKYCKYCGGYITSVMVLLVFILFEVCNTLTYRFISNWINAEEKLINFGSNISIAGEEQKYLQLLDSRNEIFYAYNAVFILSAIFGLLRIVVHFYIASKASVRIHDVMLKTVINAEVKFFDTHLHGNIINRFSKDIYNLDENVPNLSFQVIMMHLEIIGLFVLMASTNWIFLLLAFLMLVVIFLLLKYVFLPLVSNLKRLESAVHSPMIGYLNTSIAGLDTINVHGVQKKLRDEFDRHQDIFSSAYINTGMTERLFGFILDVLGCILLTASIIYFFANQNNAAASDVGLVILTFARLFGLLNLTCRQLIEFLSFLTSVERIFDYMSIKTEKSSGMEMSDWPASGRIQFDHVSLTYPTNKVQALSNISMRIEDNEKIEIIGRTGSGKSSLIYALFRFYETEGRILIDDIDIKHLSLSYRSKIGVIPHDSALFSGSLRENLDPFNKYSDEEIWKWLNKVQLPIKDLNDNLYSLNLSAGQKQLMCLVRVLLDKKKIIILDEAISNTDKITEALICSLLNECFNDCTVLNITHNFKTLKNTKIITLNDGKFSGF